MERHLFGAQQTDIPAARVRRDNLFEAVEHDGGERGRTWRGRTRGTSVYTAAALRPRLAAATLVGLALVMAATSQWLPPRQ
jgi:hypothetical protein